MQINLVPENDPDGEPYSFEMDDDIYNEAVKRVGVEKVHEWIRDAIQIAVRATIPPDRQHRER